MGSLFYYGEGLQALSGYDPNQRGFFVEQKEIGLGKMADYLRPVKLTKIIILLVLVNALAFASATLSEFSGNADETRIILQWKTSSEVDISGFEIQRSTDGHSFFEIGFLRAQGQGSSYTFIDDSIIAKVSGRDYYYRLKIRDANGNIQYSDVINVRSLIAGVTHTWGSLKALFK